VFQILIEEEQALGILVDTSSCREIQRLLRLRGDRRLGVENEVTKRILSLGEEKTPGLRLKFIESQKKNLENGTWIEYFVLYKMKKWVGTVKYMEYIFSSLSKLMSELDELPIDSIGLQEVDCSEPESYYVLIYIISDGKSIRTEYRDEEDVLGYCGGYDW